MGAVAVPAYKYFLHSMFWEYQSYRRDHNKRSLTRLVPSSASTIVRKGDRYRRPKRERYFRAKGYDDDDEDEESERDTSDMKDKAREFLSLYYQEGSYFRD
ncbi:hypothetical protein GN958_ATG23648 [Phytophthora infestans]|uniref:Uncharacterized protein n=1 Tax=Phytophthora infestans TaxID=4787 RepID=A0A8S9TKI4_PHYIN|nr:hypothetical protein GN958_ATG23648 [Phytophthora infestans]